MSVMDPETVGVTTMVRLADCPLASVAKIAWTIWPLRDRVAAGFDAELWKMTLEGRLSMTVTFVALL